MDYEKIDQQLFTYLMNLRKWFAQEFIKLRPGRDQVDVLSFDSRCGFHLDYEQKSNIELSFKTQLRYQVTNEPLIRVDLNARPHTNFIDGTFTSRDHVHIWKKIEDDFVFYGYNLEDFAQIITDDSSFNQIFCDFCSFCNINHIGVNIQTVV